MGLCGCLEGNGRQFCCTESQKERSCNCIIPSETGPPSGLRISAGSATSHMWTSGGGGVEFMAPQQLCTLSHTHFRFQAVTWAAALTCVQYVPLPEPWDVGVSAPGFHTNPKA